MKNTIAPAAINALKEALTCIYWYKSDLRSFLQNTISSPAILARVNWDGYKRAIVSDVVDRMARNQSTYRSDLVQLMNEVVKLRDFSHLEKLEDGKAKATSAKRSVAALAKLTEHNRAIEEEQRQIEARRQAKHDEMLRNQGLRDKLSEVQREFIALLSDQPQRRGYRLEKLLRELFELFDLDPKASFRLTGEQIDGAFTFDGIDYLLEAKWQDQPAGIQDLDAFNGKLTRKLENTLGLFLSVNGFSADAVTAHSSGRRLMLLMDGSDLTAVLDGRIDLVRLLLRKRRAASQTGNIYVRVQDLV